MKKLLECGVLLRLYVMIMSALYSWVMVTQDGTLTYAIAHATPSALWTAYGMAAFAALGLIDVVINDILPERFVMRQALRDRHLVSMMLSLCFAIELFTEVRYRLPYSVMPFLITYAVLIPVSAFADIHKRFKKKEQDNERYQTGPASSEDEPVGDVAPYRDRRHYHIR